MQWTEEGVVLGVRRYGETSTIVDIFTRLHGRYLGLVRGGRSRRLRPVLQPGNSVLAIWRARLSEHLGTFDVEASKGRVASIIEDPLRLAALSSLTSLAQLVAEREAHARLYDALELVLDAIETDAHWAPLLVRWELGLLEELGFGLDLSQCASTGDHNDLVYVSPKSGRAVSAAAGRDYADRLLKLPGFLIGRGATEAATGDIVSGFLLTGLFLERHVFEPRGLTAPQSREAMITRLQRSRP